MYNQQQRGLSAGMFGGMPQYQGNMQPQANYWQGNKFVIPGVDGLAQSIGAQGLDAAQAQQAEQGKEKKPGFDPMMAGLLGILPALLMGNMGGLKGDTKKGVMGGALGGLASLF